MISEQRALNKSALQVPVLLLITFLCLGLSLGQAQPAQTESPAAPLQENRDRTNAETDALRAQTARDQGQRIDDKRITRAVENKLITTSGLPSHLIDVQTDDGVVTLSGTVDSLLAKERAEQVAQSLRHVRDVQNELEVRVPERDDDLIQDDVLMELASDPATDAFELDVEVANGIVTLTGEVESWAERTLAEAAAKRVLGVTGVRNGISVAFQPDRPDLEIRTDILGLLQSDASVRESRIDVQVEDGHVRLIGAVGSALEKKQAIANAWVAGVEAVDASQLEVDPTFSSAAARQLGQADAKADAARPAQGAADAGQVGRARSGRPPGDGPIDQRDAPGRLSDEEIRSAVRAAFMFNPRVAAFEPEIEVENGTVILSGQVDNLAAKRAAEREARDVAGVRRVRNFLKVRPEEPYSDRQVRRLVQEALERNPYVENNEVRVQVRNGKVHLNGVVDSTFERLEAAEVASRIRGVVEVQNNLFVPPDVVGYTTWPFYEFQRETDRVVIKSDAEIEEDVQEELAWSPFVNAESVRVNVENGVVTLSGTVEDWNARSAAESKAYDGGARSVINNLTVISGSGTNADRD